MEEMEFETYASYWNGIKKRITETDKNIVIADVGEMYSKWVFLRRSKTVLLFRAGEIKAYYKKSYNHIIKFFPGWKVIAFDKREQLKKLNDYSDDEKKEALPKIEEFLYREHLESELKNKKEIVVKVKHKKEVLLPVIDKEAIEKRIEQERLEQRLAYELEQKRLEQLEIDRNDYIALLIDDCACPSYLVDDMKRVFRSLLLDEDMFMSEMQKECIEHLMERKYVIEKKGRYKLAKEYRMEK